MEAIHNNLKWFKALGVVVLILGVFCLAAPLVSGLAVVMLLGAVLVVSGAAHLAHAFPTRGWKGSFFGALAGIFFILVGLMLLAQPASGLLFFTLVLALLLFMDGIFAIFTFFQLPADSPRGWILFSGIVALFLGVVIWRHWPVSAAWFIGTVLGINLIFKGGALFFFSRSLKAAGADRGSSPALED